MKYWYFDIARRYGLFLIGLFIASMGVALSTKAGLGTSPIASLPYTVSLILGALSFGGWLNVLSAIQIAIQVALLPAAWLLSLSGNVNAVWWCFPIAEGVSVVASVFFLRSAFRKMERDLRDPSPTGEALGAG